jgi:hypothetical protein
MGYEDRIPVKKDEVLLSVGAQNWLDLQTELSIYTSAQPY